MYLACSQKSWKRVRAIFSLPSSFSSRLALGPQHGQRQEGEEAEGGLLYVSGRHRAPWPGRGLALALPLVSSWTLTWPSDGPSPPCALDLLWPLHTKDPISDGHGPVLFPLGSTCAPRTHLYLPHLSAGRRRDPRQVLALQSWSCSHLLHFLRLSQAQPWLLANCRPHLPSPIEATAIDYHWEMVGKWEQGHRLHRKAGNSHQGPQVDATWTLKCFFSSHR